MAWPTQKLVTALREAGAVRRCHATPWHGEYNIATHSYNAVNLLLMLHPNPSMELVKAILWHDVPERWLGDLPAPAKWSNGEFAKLYESMERKVEWVIGTYVHLTASERVWLHAVDKIELLLSAKEQLASGNQAAAQYVAALLGWFKTAVMPQSCTDFVNEHRYERLPDVVPTES